MNYSPPRPRISVLMPVHNAEDYLREAVESIAKQTGPAFEMIAVDDGSTDGSGDLLDTLAGKYAWLRIIHQENGGVAHALNIGWAQCTGDFIARMDADDVSLPHRLERQLAFLQSHPEIAVVGSWAMQFGKGAEVLWKMPASPEEIKAFALYNSPFIHPSVMLRKACVSQGTRPFDTQAIACEDYKLWAELIAQHRCANIREPLLRYRTHASQVSRLREKEQARQAMLVRNSLLRGLGLNESLGERSAHELLAREGMIATADELIEVERHLHALMHANRRTAWTSEQAMADLFHQRWAVLCSRSSASTRCAVSRYSKGRECFRGAIPLRLRTWLRVAVVRMFAGPR